MGPCMGLLAAALVAGCGAQEVAVAKAVVQSWSLGAWQRLGFI